MLPGHSSTSIERAARLQRSLVLEPAVLSSNSTAVGDFFLEDVFE